MKQPTSIPPAGRHASPALVCHARTDSYLRHLLPLTTEGGSAPENQWGAAGAFRPPPVLTARVAGIFNRSFTAVAEGVFPTGEFSRNLGAWMLPAFPSGLPLLVNFHTDPLALHPLGILISPELLQDITGTERIRLEATAIFIDQQRFPLEFDLPAPSSDQSGFWHTSPETRQKLKNILTRLGRWSTAGRALVGETSEAFSGFAGVLLQGSPPLNAHQFSPWIGSGDGSTPSCDDILTGFLLVDRHLPDSMLMCDDSFWVEARTRTPPTSLWQLLCAAQGQCSIVFERLGIEAARGRLTSADVLRCIGYGYSSGTDLLCGMLTRWQRSSSTESPTERKD